MVAQTHTQLANTIISASRPVLSKCVNMCVCVCMCIQMKGACGGGMSASSGEQKQIYPEGLRNRTSICWLCCPGISPKPDAPSHNLDPAPPQPPCPAAARKIQLQTGSVYSLKDRSDKGR